MTQFVFTGRMSFVSQLTVSKHWMKRSYLASFCLRPPLLPSAGCPTLVPCDWNTHTHTHTAVLQPFFWDYPDEPLPEEIFFWTFMVQGMITEADTPTIQLGATPTGLISNPPPTSPHFYAGCPSCRNPPTLSSLGTGTKYAGLHAQWHG